MRSRDAHRLLLVTDDARGATPVAAAKVRHYRLARLRAEPRSGGDVQPRYASPKRGRD